MAQFGETASVAGSKCLGVVCLNSLLARVHNTKSTEEDLADLPKSWVSRACSRNPARSSAQSVVAQEQKALRRRGMRKS